MTARARCSHEWLQLVDLSGLLVSEPVLVEHFPGGPERPADRAVHRLAAAWERFQTDAKDSARLRTWHDALLFDFLGLPREY